MKFLYSYSFHLPNRFVVGTNANNVVHTFCHTGHFHIDNNCKQTNTPAMDICNPYNVERVLWLLSDGDTELVKRYMSRVEREGEFNLEILLLKKFQNVVVYSESVENKFVSETIAFYEQKYGYVLCPHSALGVYVIQKYRLEMF
jgi:threonine synthase